MSEHNQHYDAIFVGSGMGALTAASLLAQLAGKRVLILESHYLAGGFTHYFTRKKKYYWDVGIHYIGEMEPGSFTRLLFDGVTKGKLAWNKMPHVFEKFMFPDFTFDWLSNESENRDNLIKAFPEEKQAIDNYLRDIRTVQGFSSKQFTLKGKPISLDSASGPELAGGVQANATTQEYLDQNFRDPKLKAVLAAQWGDYGLPPRESSFLMHAAIATHFLNGGYYPVGGSGKIAEEVGRIVRAQGGEVLVSHEVTDLLLEGETVAGVRARVVLGKGKGEVKEFRAPVVVSNAGAFNTYTKLIPEDFPIPFRDRLRQLNEKSVFPSNVTLYLGLKEDPRPMGFAGENYWIFDSYDHNAYFQRRNELVDGNVHGCFLSFPSLKNPEAEGHTGEVISFVDYAPFDKWRETKWRRRGEDYNKLKQKITEAMLAFLEKRFPGFGDTVDLTELSTPLTNEHFTHHTQGTIYGMPGRPERFSGEDTPWHQVETPIAGLYQAGADASMPGITGAMMGGLMAVSKITDTSIMRLIKNLSQGRS